MSRCMLSTHDSAFAGNRERHSWQGQLGSWLAELFTSILSFNSRHIICDCEITRSADIDLRWGGHIEMHQGFHAVATQAWLYWWVVLPSRIGRGCYACTVCFALAFCMFCLLNVRIAFVDPILSFFLLNSMRSTLLNDFWKWNGRWTSCTVWWRTCW